MDNISEMANIDKIRDYAILALATDNLFSAYAEHFFNKYFSLIRNYYKGCKSIKECVFFLAKQYVIR